MKGEVRVFIRHESDIVAARFEGRGLASQLGLSTSESTMVATAISEVARNILLYAKEGEIVLRVDNDGARRGLIIIAQDKGPGIPDLDRAMQDGFSTSNGLGLGLPGARRLMDDFQIETHVGKGTVITMRKWSR